MESTEFYKWGGSIPPEQLTVPYALSLYNVVAKFPFATLLDVCRQDGVEILILEFQVELPQYPPIPILRQERIAIELSSDENVAPKIFALRRSFPETPHQNLTYAGTPKSLCLFDQFYVDIKADLSPIKLLIRIGDWLRRAAIDELHQPGQPLEPFLLSRDSIIFHEDIFDTFATDSLAITVVHTLAVDPVILRAFRPGDPASQYASENSRYVLLPITAQPRYSNLIHYQPRHLLELTELLNEVQINLVDELCKLVVRVEKSGGVRQLAQYKPIILLKIPKIRTIGGSVEGMEWWAFLLQNSLEELSIKLGIKAKSDTGYLVPLITADPPLGLESVSIAVLRPTFALSRSIAQLLSGEIENKSHIMAIGAGALGSQIILNLAKQGFGIWTIVDEDRLLPHNFSRHGLTCWIYEAQDKSKALSTEIQNLLNDSAAAQSFTLNILNHRNNDELSATFDACNVIVDFSASRTVMRFLAKLEYPARRLSAFLGEGGQYLAVFLEGVDRGIRLDDLELQFAFALTENEELQSFYSHPTDGVFFAGSCRDTSAQIPQDRVAIHAGAASRFIRASLDRTIAQISLWKWSEQDFSLIYYSLPISPVLIKQVDNWTIRVSAQALDLLRNYRQQRLPKETGGILLGRIDRSDHIIFIVGVISSPPDSIEWPNSYIRGVKGLNSSVERISSITGGDVSYIGEWHTHPNGYPNTPSNDDYQAHRKLAEDLSIEGLPGVIAIQGQADEPYFLIGQVRQE